MIYVLLALLVVAFVVALPLITERRRAVMDAEARRDAPGGFVQLSQGITHYEWIGPVRGPVAVCVHGLTTPSFVWRGLARGLAALGYRVLVYDLYGRGYSDRPEGVQDGAFFERQLLELLEDQKVGDDFTLFGYSMGGAIATYFTAAHPDRVRQLVLLAPAGMGDGLRGLRKFITDTAVVGDWLMLALFPRQTRKAARSDRALPSSVDGIVDLQLRELSYSGYVAAVLASLRGILANNMQDAHRAIHKAGIPVLAIWGRDDDVIPLSAVGRLTEWSRNARQDVINGAGHGLVYTHTDQVIAILREALRDGLN
jgi:pimeloyl-ACP methyl ester carboxylesterase